MAHGDFRLVRLDRQRCHTPFGKSHTGVSQRTRSAAGRLRRTLQGAEVHDGLIVERGMPFVQEFPRQGGKELLPGRRVYRRADAHPAGKHAVDIAVDDSTRHPVGKGANGRSRIVAHPLQGTHAFIRPGKRASAGNDVTRRSKQIACPGIVAQPLPQLHHLVVRSPGQSLHRRETLHETHKIFISLRHARLLEDNLRHPYPIGVSRRPPGQVAPMAFIPLLQNHRKLFHTLYLSSIHAVSKRKVRQEATVSARGTKCFFEKCSEYIF